MRYFFFTLLFIGSQLSTSAQEIVLDENGCETFLMVEGDTTYVMKKYFMAFLEEGPSRDQSPEEAATIQAGHLAHMDDLAQKGIINIAGPFGDDGTAKGIVIYSVPTIEEAIRLTEMDPAVKAGRLIIRVRPWWAAVGSTLK